MTLRFIHILLHTLGIYLQQKNSFVIRWSDPCCNFAGFVEHIDHAVDVRIQRYMSVVQCPRAFKLIVALQKYFYRNVGTLSSLQS